MSLILQKIDTLAPLLKLNLSLDRVYGHRMKRLGREALSAIESDPDLFLAKMKEWVSARSMIRNVDIQRKGEVILAKDCIGRIFRNFEGKGDIADKFIALFQNIPSSTFPRALIEALKKDFSMISKRREQRIVSGLLKAFAIRGDRFHFEMTLESFPNEKLIGPAALQAIIGDKRRYEISEHTGLLVCKLSKNSPPFDRMALELFSDPYKSLIFFDQLKIALNHSFPAEKAHQLLVIALELYAQNRFHGNQKFLFELKNIFCTKPEMRSALMKIEKGETLSTIERLESKTAN